MKKVKIGLVGSGFAAGLHAEAYRRVYGFEPCLVALASVSRGADEFAKSYGILNVYKSMEEMLGEEELGELVRASGKQFCYAENFIYAPAVQKSAGLLRATKDKVLFMRGEESHSGSLIRQGCHPLSALLHLKKIGAKEQGNVASVVADMGYLTPALRESEKRYIQARPKDVDDSSLKDQYITEKVETKKGWQSVFLAEEAARGYVGELHDFMRCITGEKEKPESDFALAQETVKAIYGVYQSAREGKRIDL